VKLRKQKRKGQNMAWFKLSPVSKLRFISLGLINPPGGLSAFALNPNPDF
jgi:hypothetical protein